VGSGPFPTEDKDVAGNLIRDRGREFGSVTGRSRRCGWIDLPQLRYAVMVNGIDSLVVTKLDVLDTLDEIPVCTSYQGLDGGLEELPGPAEAWEKLHPVYQTLPGWKQNTFGIARYDELPRQARTYLEFIAGELGVEVSLISTGPERGQSVVRSGSRLERLLSTSRSPRS
jgi:adenylosuccinate synthase